MQLPQQWPVSSYIYTVTITDSTGCFVCSSMASSSHFSPLTVSRIGIGIRYFCYRSRESLDHSREPPPPVMVSLHPVSGPNALLTIDQVDKLFPAMTYKEWKSSSPVNEPATLHGLSQAGKLGDHYTGT